MWARALVVAIEIPMKPQKYPRNTDEASKVSKKLVTDTSVLCLLKDLEELFFLVKLFYCSEEKSRILTRNLKRKPSRFLQQNIEDFFEGTKKDGAIFYNLTAACEIVWHLGFT